MLPEIGFVAQDLPVYDTFTPAELLRACSALNRVFDAEMARDRWRELAIELDQKVATMSGGQRAQVALALALAKCPSVLLLDEPLASLDPLARHEFLQTLMAAVADTGVTVLLSSHLLAELERVCDWIIVLGRGRVQVAGDVDDLVASHRWVRTPAGRAVRIDGAVVDQRSSARETVALVRSGAHLDGTISKPTLEELILAYLGNPEAVALPGPEALESIR